MSSKGSIFDLLGQRCSQGHKSEADCDASYMQSERTTPTPRLRRNSDLSENSAASGNRSAVTTYDSGNYSTSSNTSELACPFETELHNHCQHVHALLRERDQSLNLAIQDVRKLRSELERLNKSEEWYKKELRSQKSTRLDALERLYAQERKYMQENQRLQRECMRLYDKCGVMEKELQSKQDAAVQKLIENEEEQKFKDDIEVGSTLELQNQKSLIDDQQKLINVLRKQKHALLDDLSRLNEEKDAKVMQLQETLAGVEVENSQMTSQCMRLLVERQTLEDTIQLKDAELLAENAEKLKMKILIEELKQQSDEQQQKLALKEHEINEIQQKFKDNMKTETNMDEMHRLCITYHDEINTKSAEITTLKKSLKAVQSDLDSLMDLQTQNDEQGRQIEQLNFTLEAKNFELINLQETTLEKTEQITELQGHLEKIRTEHDNTIGHLHSTQTTLQNVKQELIILHEQYANMCALCEQTRFQLELLEIEKGKLQFQAESDKREIEQLRGKLKDYLRHTEELGTRINELEEKLNCSKIEKEKLKAKLKELENRSVIEEERQRTNDHALLLVHSRIIDDAHDVNRNGDDSGFLDATKSSLNEYESNATRSPTCTELTDAHATHLKNLSSKNEMTSEKDSKDFCLDEAADSKDFTAISERQQQLMDFLNDQSQLTVERRQILEAFETLIKKEVGSQETSINNQVIFKQNNMIDEAKVQTNFATVNKPAEIDTLRKILSEKNKQCSELGIFVKTQSKELRNLQQQLFESNDKYMQTHKQQNQYHQAQTQKYEDVIQRLQAENERLAKELQNILEAKNDIDNTLEKQNQLILDLKAKLSELESIASPSETQLVHSSEKQELLHLRKKVEQLEERLQVAVHHDEDRRNERVRLIRKLLEQQNSKVKQLTESQEEWEELLAALHTAQALEENTRAQLQLKHAELNELNELFAEQNEELRRLQEKALLANDNTNNEVNKMRLQFQQQLEEMQSKLSAQLADSEAQQLKIEELQGINDRLARRLNEDYAEEVGKNQKQLRSLQTKIESLQAERNTYAERLVEMENEMQQLKKSKREALLLPPEFVVLPVSADASSTIDTSSSSCDVNNSLNVSDSDNNDHMRILTKVLEAEYRRKMKRYDVHIHTLLNNIKKLKKSLRSAEQRAALLSMEQSRTKEELYSLQLTRRQLEEMRLKCEQNQHTIKALENTLEMERKKFEASDLGKAVNTRESTGVTLARDEPAHEVANLIDDYKKLIKQSALATQRPKTSAIIDLIQRSNQCVPNLHKLEKTVDGLRGDLEHFLSSHALNIRQQQNANKLEGPSLMEELRAATESC